MDFRAVDGAGLAAFCESFGAAANNRVNSLSGFILVPSPGRVDLGIVGLGRPVGTGTRCTLVTKTVVGGSILLSNFLLDGAVFFVGGSQCTAELALHVVLDPVVVWPGDPYHAVKTRPSFFYHQNQKG